MPSIVEAGSSVLTPLSRRISEIVDDDESGMRSGGRTHICLVRMFVLHTTRTSVTGHLSLWEEWSGQYRAHILQIGGAI